MASLIRCVFMGDVRLARELWAYVEHPLHCALIASHVLNVIASRASAAKIEARAAAAEIEAWATGVMDEIQEQEVGHWLLSQHVPAWGLGSIVNLALQVRSPLMSTDCTLIETPRYDLDLAPSDGDRELPLIASDCDS